MAEPKKPAEAEVPDDVDAPDPHQGAEFTSWEFFMQPTTDDVIEKLKTLPDWWGLRPEDYIEYIQPLSQSKNFSQDKTRKDYRTTWTLYVTVAGRVRMINDAAVKHKWRVDFEPEPVTPTGIPGMLQYDSDRIVYREHCVIYDRDSDGLVGRKPGTAWVPASGGGGAVASNRFEKCLVAGTRVLTADLRWVPIESLVPGDEVVGFDEEFNGRGSGHGSCFRRSTVIATKKLVRPVVRIKTEWGSVVSSTDHMWVRCKAKGEKQWRAAEGLKVGDRLAGWIEPWEEPESWEAGYLSGFLDGEGTWRNTGQLVWTQKPGDVFEKVERLFKELGFTVSRGWQREPNRPEYDDVQVGWLTGGLREAVRAVAMLRPERLLPKAAVSWEGRRLWGRSVPNHVTIQDIEVLGKQEVVAVQTTTSTFVAEGLLSHNCETSARGRAIAAWGFGILPGSGVASLDEMLSLSDMRVAVQSENQRRSRGEGPKDRKGLDGELLSKIEEFRQVSGSTEEQMEARVKHYVKSSFGKDIDHNADGSWDLTILKDGEVVLFRNRMVEEIRKIKNETME